jgi:hypothetical protein
MNAWARRFAPLPTLRLLRNVKSQGIKRRNVRLPLSLPIVRALQLARSDDALSDPVKMFPGCRFRPQRDGLPEFGHALRHAYQSIAADISVDPLSPKMLFGHSVGKSADVTDTYASRKMLTGALGHEQRRISAEIMKRLGIGGNHGMLAGLDGEKPPQIAARVSGAH